MGFQINAHIEIKIEGAWHHYSIPSLDRNYDMFAYLGGEFGNDRKKHFLPKGLPSDVSIATKIGYKHEEEDLFSPSWLSAEEIAEWAIAYPGVSLLGIYSCATAEYKPYQLGYLYENSTENFLKYREDYPSEIEDIRMVFWFK